MPALVLEQNQIKIAQTRELAKRDSEVRLHTIQLFISTHLPGEIGEIGAQANLIYRVGKQAAHCL